MANTTKKDFELFCQEGEKWIELFGLTDYEVHFSHEYLESGTLAACRRNHDGRVAKLTLNEEWVEDYVVKNNRNLKLAAFEEVCHLVLNEIMNVAYERFTSQEEMNRAEHGVIRRLQNVIFDCY